MKTGPVTKVPADTFMFYLKKEGQRVKCHVEDSSEEQGSTHDVPRHQFKMTFDLDALAKLKPHDTVEAFAAALNAT